MRKRSQRIVAFALLPIIGAGCIGRPLLGPMLARSNSLIRTNQQSEIRWLDAAALREPPPGVDAQTWADHLTEECLGAAEVDRPKLLPGLLLPLVPIAVEFTLDTLNRRMLAESKLYAAEFAASNAIDDVNRMVGFELRRNADRYDGATPACLIRFAICQNEATGLAIIRPVFFQTRASRAKLLAFDRTLCTRVDLVLCSTTSSRTVPISAGTLQIDDYDLAAARPLLLARQVIAIVPWPPPGVVTATIVVVEHDAHHTEETFTQLSNLLAATTRPTH